MTQTPARTGDMPQSGSDEHQRTFAIGNSADDPSPPTNLVHDPLQPDGRPMLARKRHIRERFSDTVVDDVGGLGQLHLAELANDARRFLLGCGTVLTA